MKFLVSILLVLCFRLAAGEFEEVEQLFEQGRFEECDTLIENALQANPPEDQRVKLQAIREYIWGNHPEKITENVKKAREIAGHRGWLTADLLNHSSLLIRRAGDWKARGIPEYQDLSNAAAELLKQLKDGGFHIPQSADGRIELTSRELAAILSGIKPQRYYKRYSKSLNSA